MKRSNPALYCPAVQPSPQPWTSGSDPVTDTREFWQVDSLAGYEVDYIDLEDIELRPASHEYADLDPVESLDIRAFWKRLED